jgi:hypothetical protein
MLLLLTFPARDRLLAIAEHSRHLSQTALVRGI